MTSASKERREPLLISRKEAAHLLGVSPRTVSNLAKAGHLRVVTIGRSLRFDLTQVVVFAGLGNCGLAGRWNWFCRAKLALTLWLMKIAVLLALIAAAEATLASVVTDNPAGWTLTFSDEFSGSTLDASKWSHRGLGPRRDAVNTADAVSVSDGLLRITTYTSGGSHYTGMIATRDKRTPRRNLT